jgi:[protein-PII] uridylyltransferase
MPGPNFRVEVLQARDTLRAGRERLKQLHADGAAGREVCAGLTDLIDAIIADLFARALEQTGSSDLADHVALIPHGGCGRRDVAPYSDVDLMMLVGAVPEDRVRPLARRLTQDICDTGFTLGFSFRTLAEACTLAVADATVFTSVAEARYLAGSEGLFRKFQDRLRRGARHRLRTLLSAIEESRQEECRNYGETNFLLMPNLKRSLGGLRDIQLMRWVGFARYGHTDPAALHALGVLSRNDRERLDAAHEFLLRLRNELHFHAGRAQDVLDREEQVRIAHLRQYEGTEGVLPVEQFMQEYFHYTSEVRNCVTHFLASATSRAPVRKFLTNLVSHNMEGDFRVGPLHIGATRRGMDKLQTDLIHVLRLMDLANLQNKLIEHRTWEVIRTTMANRCEVELKPEVTRRFLSLMSQPARLGPLLRGLHELRVLEQIIPGMSHTRCLLQFNEFHKYTVDEHSIRAVEEATRLVDEPGPLGEAYRGIKDKRTLHLALLLHDLGKGYTEDHSEVGARLALETARRLHLPERETEVLRFLVHKHLLLSHLAQFRDIHDPDVIVGLAVQVGSPEVLQMLYVLTCADLAAVGPGVLNQWKLDLFTQLYQGVRRELTGNAWSGPADRRSVREREKLRQALQGQADDPWWVNQLEALPPAYLFQGTSERTLAELQRLRTLSRQEAVAWSRYDAERQAVEYSIGTYDDIVPGIFHRLTGVLTSQRMNILSAEIHTLADGLVLDRFHVSDQDFSGQPPASRLDEVCEKLERSLTNPADRPPKFSTIWGESPSGTAAEAHRPPPKVLTDNSTSEKFTIVDVFAVDRRGLLYAITHQLFALGLSVHMAKIGTHLDQVVDVFYVTAGDGTKITDKQHLEQIRDSLLNKIDEFERI